MAEYNNIVTPSVSNIKVARLLQTSSAAASNLCTHKNINMWAKYKPVVSSVHTYADQQLDYTEKRWKTVNELKALNIRPWWYGPVGSPVYTIPVIDNLTEAKVSALWQYNRQLPASPHRMLDFLQYNHAAVPPLLPSGVISGTINTATYYNLGISVNSDSDWTFTELREVLGVVDNINLYLGVAAYVPTVGTIAVSSDTPLTDNDDGDACIISLWVTRTSGIDKYLHLQASGAEETSIYVPYGGTVRLYMYLCTAGGQTGVEDAGNKYSIRLCESITTYGVIDNIILGSINIRVPFSIPPLSDTTAYSRKSYAWAHFFWKDDNLYAFFDYIDAINANIKVGPAMGSGVASQYYAYGSMRIDAVATMRATSGSSAWTEVVSIQSFVLSGAGTLADNRTVTAAINGSDAISQIKVYSTKDDAMNDRNGTMSRIIPIPSCIWDNFGDADHVGEVETDLDLKLAIVQANPETNFIIQKQI